MKITHKVPIRDAPSVVLDERYQAEVDAVTLRAEKAYRDAVRNAERAWQKAQRHQADLLLRQAARDARRQVEVRWLELKAYERQERKAPVTGERRSGRRSVRRVSNREVL